MKAFKTLGMFVGAIAGIVIIKQLDLPWYLTILTVGALLVGMIYGIAVMMGDGEAKAGKTEASTEGNGNASLDKN
ncbi:MAG: hypothetical protein M0009_01580 [Deltaproteobacteria bacterium]|nr:hypothetical protein [Deltaproteobacteria bacterium]